MNHAVIIPSLGRYNYILKYRDTPLYRFKHPFFNCKLWVSEKEQKQYSKMLSVIDPEGYIELITDSSKNICETRQAILTYCINNNIRYLFMPDDDIRIYERTLENKSLGLRMDYSANKKLFEHLYEKVKTYPLVAIHNRFMFSQNEARWEKNYKIHCNYFIDVNFFNRHQISFVYKDLVHYEDRVIQLLLISKGFETLTTSYYLFDQRHGNNSVGGCSLYRNVEESNKAAYTIHRDFPEYTSLFIKNNWSIGARTEVKFYLKRFLKEPKFIKE